MEFIRENRPSLRVVLLVGCLGLFGLTGISLIISGVVTGEIYYTDYDFSAIWERFQKRFLWVGIIIPLVGIVVSILIAAKITEPVHEIIERAERFRRGDRSAFRKFFNLYCAYNNIFGIFVRAIPTPTSLPSKLQYYGENR